MLDFVLGPYIVKPSLGQVERGEAIVRLRARVMDLLVFFMQHPGVVLSPQRLLEGVWGTTFVSHSALTRTIAELRGALEDDVERPWLLETIPKRGYRLLARPERTGAAEPSARLWLRGDDVSLALPVGCHVIGRDVSAAIVLASPWVSRHHASIEVTVDGVTIRDLGSRNGTYVNDQPVTDVFAVSHGDEIRVGRTRLTAYLAAPDLPTAADTPKD